MSLGLLEKTSEKRLSITHAELFNKIDEIALQALLDEINLDYKPGLVCRHTNGSHTDMNYFTFIKSIDSLKGYFGSIARYGFENVSFDKIKALGVKQESIMLTATQRINTHKGAIFNLGFSSAALGKCLQRSYPINCQTVCQTLIDSWSYDLLNNLPRQVDSHGQQILKKYGLTGAVEMVANGFQIIQTSALPTLYQTYYCTNDFEKAKVQTLMVLISLLPDTNLVWRGELKGLQHAQNLAKSFLAQGGVYQKYWKRRLEEINASFIKDNLSPGGSADLLSVTIFFFRVENEFNHLI